MVVSMQHASGCLVDLDSRCTMREHCCNLQISRALSLCQELDGSRLLDLSKTVTLRKQGFSGAMDNGAEESAKLKLDRR